MVFLESHVTYSFEKTFGLECVLSYHNESFFWVKFCQKVKLKLKIEKWSEFGRFPSPKVREKKSGNCQIPTFGFECVAINIKGWLQNLYFIFGL